MNETNRTPAGTALTDLILDLFKVSSGMVAAGDRLVAGLGLTSARWQILGAIAASERPQPVSWVARDIGANRQNVQRIVNDLQKSGLIAFEANPHHRRAQLIVLTEKGKNAFEAAMRLQVPWVNGLTEGLSVKEIEMTHRVISELRSKLAREDVPEEDEHLPQQLR